MRNIKVLAIPMILIFGLLISGLAYAHWEKIITITGSVATGDFDLIIVEGSPSDSDSGIDPGYTKDIADTTIIIDPNDPGRAIITITNAYPSYEVFWHVTIRNVGTIPAKLKEIRVVDPTPCITVEAWDGLGRQIDPESWGGPLGDYQEDVSGRIHVEQCAEPGGVPYTVTIEFEFWNWNEVP